MSGRRRKPGQYTVPEVARQLGISERAVRLRIEVGTLSAIRDGRQWWVTLPGLDEAVVGGSRSGSAGGSGSGSEGGSRTGTDDEPAPQSPPTEPLEAAYRVTPAEIEQAVARTSAQYMGDLRTMLAEVGKVYEGQLAAKDETIAELRRRADVAEAELEGARLRLAEATVPPVVVVAGQDATEGAHATATTPVASRPSPGFWRRLRRVWRGR